MEHYEVPEESLLELFVQFNNELSEAFMPDFGEVFPIDVPSLAFSLVLAIVVIALIIGLGIFSLKIIRTRYQKRLHDDRRGIYRGF
jgi:hypothetical protein